MNSMKRGLLVMFLLGQTSGSSLRPRTSNHRALEEEVDDNFFVSDPSDDECLNVCDPEYAYVSEAFASSTLEAASAAAAENPLLSEKQALAEAQWWMGTFSCGTVAQLYTSMNNDKYVASQRYGDDKDIPPSAQCFVDVCCIDSTLGPEVCCTIDPVNLAIVVLIAVGALVVVLVLVVATPLGNHVLPEQQEASDAGGGNKARVDITGMSVPEEYLTETGRVAGRSGAVVFFTELFSCCWCFMLGTCAATAMNIPAAIVTCLFSVPTCCGLAGGWVTTYSTKDVEGLRYLAIASLASFIGRLLILLILAAAIAATGDTTGIFLYPTEGALILVLIFSGAWLAISGLGMYCGFKGHLKEAS